MTDQLKPCPFCGEDAEHVHIFAGEEIVQCTNECCFVRPSITCELPEECFELWNTRAAGASEGQADARRTAEYWKAEHLAGNAEIAALRKERDELLTALADCRGACPIPDAGSDIEGHWAAAMGNPGDVPRFVADSIAALRERIAGMEKDAEPKNAD